MYIVVRAGSLEQAKQTDPKEHPKAEQRGQTQLVSSGMWSWKGEVKHVQGY